MINSVVIRVRVTPGASDNAIIGWQDNVLRVRVREVAEKGRANAAVRRLLAESLGIPRAAITLTRGVTARNKVFKVDGLTADELEQRIHSP